jgi:hypothetical protein
MTTLNADPLRNAAPIGSPAARIAAGRYPAAR